jgi:monooxygenase
VVCDLVANLLRHMEDKHATTVTPSLRPADAEMERRPFCGRENFSSGHVMRSQDIP